MFRAESKEEYTPYAQVQHCTDCTWVSRGLVSHWICPECGSAVKQEVGRKLLHYRRRWRWGRWVLVGWSFVPLALVRTPSEDGSGRVGNIVKIVVPTEEDKQQLLLASRYIHDLRSVDTDIDAVNTLAHLYLAPLVDRC